jgi:hypothetical protein
MRCPRASRYMRTRSVLSGVDLRTEARGATAQRASSAIGRADGVVVHDADQPGRQRRQRSVTRQDAERDRVSAPAQREAGPRDAAR